MTPSARAGRRRRARPTTSGVPPEAEMPSTIGADLVGGVAAVVADPLHHRGGRALADLRTAPSVGEVHAGHPGLRGERHPRRVAELARRAARAARTRSWRAPRSSGPRASRRPGWTAAPRRPASRRSTPSTGRNSLACRLPRVIVPVLSSSSVFTSPAASTARPDIASTLRCTSRSMPAMPIADSSAPIVVGIRQTSSETSTIPVTPLPVSAWRVRRRRAAAPWRRSPAAAGSRPRAGR